MGYYIIIRGPLGSGKTTISRRLSLELGAHYVSIDEILEEYNLEEWEEGYVSLTSFIRANEIAVKLALKYLVEGRAVVFDGNFYYRSQIEDLENRLIGHSPQIFTLGVPLHMCIERDAMRRQSFGPEATGEVFRKSAGVDRGIVIDATGSVADTINRILTKLTVT